METLTGLGFKAQLSARYISGNQTTDLGIISTRMVTDAFGELLVDELQGTGSNFSLFKYHDTGTGTTAESVADTTLETPTGDARVAGTQTEGASTKTYRSVATMNYTASLSITEHGIFNAASAGTLMDRSVFSVISVSSGDSIEFTYELTITTGG